MQIPPPPSLKKSRYHFLVQNDMQYSETSVSEVNFYLLDMVNIRSSGYILKKDFSVIPRDVQCSETDFKVLGFLRFGDVVKHSRRALCGMSGELTFHKNRTFMKAASPNMNFLAMFYLKTYRSPLKRAVSNYWSKLLCNALKYMKNQLSNF